MYGRYQLFIVAIIAIYASVLASWEFFRPIDNKDVSSRQYDILRQSDQFLSTRDNVEFQSLTCSTLKLKFPTGNQLLGLDANLQVVPVDLKLDVSSNTLEWDALHLHKLISIGDNLLKFTNDKPTLEIRHKLDYEFMTLQSYLHTGRTTPMISLQSEVQNDPFNGSFLNILCNQATLYRITNDGSHMYKSYYDKPILDLHTYTTNSRTAPAIKITQDNNSTPFVTCLQDTSKMFSIESNGDLKWRDTWNINTTPTNLNVRYNTTTYASFNSSNADMKLYGNLKWNNNWFINTSSSFMDIGYNGQNWATFKTSNADAQFNGNIYFGNASAGACALYFSGAGNDGDWGDCVISNRTLVTNDVSELLIQKGRNTNDRIRLRCNNFEFQTPGGNENMNNLADNNIRFSITNSSVNAFANSLAVSSTEVNIGSLSSTKTLSLNGRTINPTYLTITATGYNGSTLGRIYTCPNDRGSNHRPFVFTTGQIGVYSEGIFMDDDSSWSNISSTEGIDYTVDNCFKVPTSRLYRIDFDISIKGTLNQQLLINIVKNPTSSDIGILLAAQTVDINNNGFYQYHVSAAAYLDANDRAAIVFDNWAAPEETGVQNNTAGNFVNWRYATFTMHSI